jgi:hypothetical protein
MAKDRRDHHHFDERDDIPPRTNALGHIETKRCARRTIRERHEVLSVKDTKSCL